MAILSDKKSVFENLYNNFKVIEQKKEEKRRRSIESIPFKPQINRMSHKIIEEKRKFTRLAT